MVRTASRESWKVRSLLALWIGLLAMCLQGEVSADEAEWLVEARAGWKRVRQRRIPRLWSHYVRRWNANGNLDYVRFRVLFGENYGDRYVTLRVPTEHIPVAGVPDPAHLKQFATVVAVENARYSFSIRRPSPDLSWAVRLIQGQDVPKPTRLSLAITRVLPVHMLLSFSHHITIPEALSSGYCRVVSAEEVMENGERLFRIEMESKGPSDIIERPRPWAPEGKHVVFLDMERDWVVRIEEYYDTQGYLERSVKEVDESTGLVGKIRGTLTYLRENVRESRSEERFKYYFEYDETPPEDLFRLTGYGIPEPAELQPSRHWTWLLVVVGALLVLGGVWSIQRNMRRRQPSESRS